MQLLGCTLALFPGPPAFSVCNIEKAGTRLQNVDVHNEFIFYFKGAVVACSITRSYACDITKSMALYAGMNLNNRLNTQR